MKIQVERALVALAVSLLAFGALAGCGGEKPAGAPGAATGTTAAEAPAEAPPEAYSYPAPVSGHFEDANIGSFDFVDGLAWENDEGTVVHVASKAIASPKVAASPCPATLGRSIELVRDARYAEVTLDAKGRSRFFNAGSQYQGTSREEDASGRYWKIEVSGREAGRIAGEVVHRDHGAFRFDLPLAEVGPAEMSANQRMAGGEYGVASDATPPADAVVAAYRELHAAARAKNWPAFLEAHGFDRDLVRAIRGLPGIEADLEAHAARFLDPGAPGETTSYTATTGVMAEGKNPQGQSFANFYSFAACGDRMVLVSIGENPQ
jgi:hypothetical protein